MKMYVPLWYLAEFFLEWKMFQTEFLEIKTQIWCSVTLPFCLFQLNLVKDILCTK